MDTLLQLITNPDVIAYAVLVVIVMADQADVYG
jgi:hypothetical protein